MKKLFLAFALVACFAVSALSQGAPPWTIQEVDGSPRVNSPTLIKVTNGTLSCTGKTCTITISGGGGGSPGGSNTQVQYNAAGSFGGISVSRRRHQCHSGVWEFARDSSALHYVY
jgi:hypothetical protein